MTRARPLRFLALVLGLWVGARAIMLTTAAEPTRTPSPAASTQPNARLAPSTLPPASMLLAGQAPRPSPDPSSLIREFPYKGVRPPFSFQRRRAVGPSAAELPLPADPPGLSEALQRAVDPAQPPALPAVPRPPGSPSARSRWSASAWLLARDGEGRAALVPGGILGGSQAGARLLYRVGSGLALSGRAYAPLGRSEGAEVALGIDWQPAARVPVHLLAERRQDVGGAGRSAFALTLYGGTSGRLPGGLRGEAYAQAGMVGTRSRDLFVDASARASVPVGRAEIGASAWGAAQPGAARLDAGPHLSYRLPIEGANVRLQADWRFRIAGDAAPGSGPAITIAADF